MLTMHAFTFIYCVLDTLQSTLKFPLSHRSRNYQYCHFYRWQRYGTTRAPRQETIEAGLKPRFSLMLRPHPCTTSKRHIVSEPPVLASCRNSFPGEIQNKKKKNQTPSYRTSVKKKPMHNSTNVQLQEPMSLLGLLAEQGWVSETLSLWAQMTPKQPTVHNCKSRVPT